MWCSYLATSLGKVLCCRLDLSSCAPLWMYFLRSQNGPKGAKGHFKDYGMGATYNVLFIVLSLWEGGVFNPRTS